MLVWCSPSNPTGVVYSKEEAEEIYEWIFKNDLWILSDELYEHLVYEGETSPSPAIYDPELKNTIIVNGVSKSYSMTGWRVCLLYTSPSPRDMPRSRMPSSA